MKHTILLAVALLAAPLAWATQEQTGPVKAQLKIEAGLEAAYNLDHGALGFQNYLREIGLWIELFNADNGLPQVDADPEAEEPRVQIHVKNFKFAVKTFSQKEVNNNGVELASSYSNPSAAFLLQDTTGDSVDVALTWKGFWLGLVTSTDGSVGWGGSSNVFTPKALGFDYAGSNANTDLTGAGLYRIGGRSAKLLAAQGLFVPDSTQWDNNPSQFAPNPTYYTLGKTGGVESSVLTAGGLEVNPYDGTTTTAGILRVGYAAKDFSLTAGIASQGFGKSLFSVENDLNKDGAFNGQVNFSWLVGRQFALDLSALGGVNYETLGNPYGAGGRFGYSWGVADDVYVVPTVGFDYVYKKTLAGFRDLWQASTGVKFLWGGDGLDVKNDFSSQETFRGASAVVLTDQDQLVNVQVAVFEPASRRSFVRNLGVQAFGEVKNVTGLSEVDGGSSLWGVGAKVDYLLPSSSLNPYGYLHYKVNDTTENAGQLVTRVGLEYSGIKSLVVDAYYLMGRLNTDQDNRGNLVCDLKFSY